jgi:hypothetical protein
MKLLATLRPVKSPAEGQALAETCGLTLAEARMRLAAEPPALLARLEDEAADQAVSKLRIAGLSVLACPLPVPGDQDRTVARTFAITQESITFAPRTGAALEMAWGSIGIILRASRSVRSRTERSEKERHFSPGTALATGGLKLTSTSRKTTQTETEDTEQFLLVYDRADHCAGVYEKIAVFTCLGAAMQASRTANMTTLARMLRERATSAFYDDRLLRLGRRSLPFVMSSDSHTGGDNVSRTVTETADSADILAQVLRQAVSEGLIP